VFFAAQRVLRSLATNCVDNAWSHTLPAAILAADPADGPGRRVIFVFGNDVEANAEVVSLVEKLGFEPILLGKLTDGGLLQQYGGPLMIQSLIKTG
jgi:hypothetical protein